MSDAVAPLVAEVRVVVATHAGLACNVCVGPIAEGVAHVLVPDERGAPDVGRDWIVCGRCAVGYFAGDATVAAAGRGALEYEARRTRP